ncbi:unnamed protein product, partial [Ectocarpus sp. 4 AP-2014]
GSNFVYLQNIPSSFLNYEVQTGFCSRFVTRKEVFTYVDNKGVALGALYSFACWFPSYVLADTKVSAGLRTSANLGRSTAVAEFSRFKKRENANRDCRKSNTTAKT